MYANGAVDTSYDYAVPELGTVPLLNQDAGAGRGTTISNAISSDQDNGGIFSKSSRGPAKTEDKKVRRACDTRENLEPKRAGRVLFAAKFCMVVKNGKMRKNSIFVSIFFRGSRSSRWINSRECQINGEKRR